ncbi:Rhodanese-like protein [Aureobasidium subglaciale]|nr:Rhodanese-like protein [Aureobasidium subglaciale]
MAPSLLQSARFSTFSPLRRSFNTPHTVPSQRAMSLSSYLVKPAELSAALKGNAPTRLATSPRVIPLCASWFMPNDPQKRTGYEVFKKGHIPNARFFDLDAVADKSSPYPHMLPSAQVFSQAMRKLGIRRDDNIVVYDSAELGIFSAPRVAWTLRVFGHPSIHILNNYKLWVEEGFPVEEGEQSDLPESQYPESPIDSTKVAAFEEVKEIAKDYNKEGREGVQILDARSLGRWSGVDPEPRAGLSSGHIPGSISIALPELLDPETKTLLSRDELLDIFRTKGVDPLKPIISSCGTGVTASVIDAALTEAGFPETNRKVYDGSWTEWAQRVQATENLIHKSQ